jgi:hypothetical protein
VRGLPYLRISIAAALVLLVGSLGLLGLSRRPAPARPAGLSPQVRADQAIHATLRRQSAALLGGDEQGWLRDVDPPLAGELRRLYANLRGLQVSGWVPKPATVTGTGQTGPAWHTDTRIRVCFAGPTCTREHSADSLTAKTTWRVTDDRDILSVFSWDGERARPSRPTPWERDTLTFAAGDRVIVAAPSGGMRPAGWLPAAERAAVVADRYTLAEPRVGKYLVFLAGRREWKTWFSAFTDREVLGYALRPSETSAFIVIDTTRVRTDAHGETVLRHEMGHIATRFGPSTRVGEWATEGMAEYVAWAGRPVTAYDRTADARLLTAKIKWAGRLDLEWSPTPTYRSGYYAMGFFAMRCLGETYGEPELLDFFDAMAHGGRSPAQASEQSFQTPWETAQAACIPIIKTWLRR